MRLIIAYKCSAPACCYCKGEEAGGCGAAAQAAHAAAGDALEATASLQRVRAYKAHKRNTRERTHSHVWQRGGTLTFRCGIHLFCAAPLRPNREIEEMRALMKGAEARHALELEERDNEHQLKLARSKAGWWVGGEERRGNSGFE